MIQEVSFSKTTYACLPHKFEAGTQILLVLLHLKVFEFITDIGLIILQNMKITFWIMQLLKYLKLMGLKSTENQITKQE